MSKHITFFEIKKQIDAWEIKRQNIKKIFSWNKLSASVSELQNNKDFYIVLSALTPQQKAPQHETRLIKIFNGKKIPAKLNMGDFVTKDKKYYEVKCSTPSAHGNILNLVQIRIFQHIDFYLCVFIDDIKYESNFVFLLTKQQMEYECNIIGNSAHITKNKVAKTKIKEYRISINLDDVNNKNTKRWLLKYRNKQLEKKIF